MIAPITRIYDTAGTELAVARDTIAVYGTLVLPPRKNERIVPQPKLKAVVMKDIALTEEAVRRIVAGKAPYLLFSSSRVYLESLHLSIELSLVWGDFDLYTTGEPTISTTVFVPGFTGMPPPQVVAAAAAFAKDAVSKNWPLKLE